MADKKTDLSNTPLSDDPDNPTKGLSAKSKTASHPAGAEPGLDTLFHRTSLRFCCAANVVTASEAREPQSLPRLQQMLVMWPNQPVPIPSSEPEPFVADSRPSKK